MGQKDILKYSKIFEELKRRIKNNTFYEMVNGKMKLNLPSPKESSIGHIRPKARNGNDKIELRNGMKIVKQAYWLNKEFIYKIINN